ncbi:MAG: hypothetical protein HY063_12490 [Bacteroidetes bacterium]|nr:hypothetical protein [Bacteroidota bacterium]
MFFKELEIKIKKWTETFSVSGVEIYYGNINWDGTMSDKCPIMSDNVRYHFKRF